MVEGLAAQQSLRCRCGGWNDNHEADLGFASRVRHCSSEESALRWWSLDSFAVDFGLVRNSQGDITVNNGLRGAL
jgi:hypothetical protein